MGEMEEWGLPEAPCSGGGSGGDGHGGHGGGRLHSARPLHNPRSLLRNGRHCSLHQGPHCLILNRNRIPQIPQIPQILGQCSVAGSLGLAESGAA